MEGASGRKDGSYSDVHSLPYALSSATLKKLMHTVIDLSYMPQ